jgi:hypothetical protein
MNIQASKLALNSNGYLSSARFEVIVMSPRMHA